MGGGELKKIISYVSFVVKARKIGFLGTSILYVLNIVFAAGLYAVASFLISLAALHPTYDKMMIPVVSVRMFGVGRAVLSYSERYFSHDNTFHILKELRLKLYDKMKVELPNYDVRRADSLSQMILDIELLQEGILRLIYPFVSSFLLWIGASIILCIFSKLLAMIYALMFFFYVYAFPALFFYISTKKKEELEDQKEKIYEDFLELKEGLVEITSFGMEHLWEEKTKLDLNKMNGVLYHKQKKIAFCESLLGFMQGLANLIFLLTGCYLFYKKQISGTYLAAIMLGLTAFVTETMLPPETYFKFEGLKKSIDTVFGKGKNETMQKKDSSPQKNKRNQEAKDETNRKAEKQKEMLLSVEHLNFSYQGNKKIFCNFSTEFSKGRPTAILGESGIGKSTLINILLGFQKADSGTICYAGEDFNNLTEEERMRLFSVVDQKPFFFHQSLFENLRIAKPNVSREEVQEVLNKVGLQDFCQGLKDGMDTSLYEWGANLSGGELQRLAIARALLKEAPVYIFDEPTAGLDTVHEKKILELIVSLAKEHIVVLITHRMVMTEQFELLQLKTPIS